MKKYLLRNIYKNLLMVLNLFVLKNDNELKEKN